MPNKKFLETYSLYRSFEHETESRIPEIEKPSIIYRCPECDSAQTHNCPKILNFEFTFSAKAIIEMHYLCAGCKRNNVTFYVKIHDDLKTIMKVGQFPAWSISGDKNIEKLLGTHRQYLRRGLICESQGYGIAAYAYYRRIVEEVIDQLITDIKEIIPENDYDTFSEAYEKIKKTHNTTDKIKLVKDLLPSSLIINKMNPLGILYKSLSEGLHADSEEKCLKHSAAIRTVLIFLSSQISEAKSQKKEFTESMKGLLDDK